MTDKHGKLIRFGFSFERGGAHTARTMMLQELVALLAYVDRLDADRIEYQRAVCVDNCLGKRSGKTRSLTYWHLSDLYSLSPDIPLFRALRYFWDRDPSARPLLALLCAYARDPLLRSTALLILKTHEGAQVTRESLEEFIDSLESDRFSPATLKSTAQNINSTWTQSGHLKGHVRKVRSRANPTAATVSYALLLGYLTGVRGQVLFQTEYFDLLDCPYDKGIGLAEDASRKGWIVFKHIGNVVDVAFPALISPEESELARE